MRATERAIQRPPAASTASEWIGPAKVIRSQPRVIRRLRLIAGAVVVGPMLGCIAAAVLAWREGLHVSDVAIFLAMYLACGFGISLGYHRYFAHRSFKTGRFMQRLLAVLGSTNAQGPIVFWVATHRRHHRYSDEAGDPHSPNLSGDGFGNFLRGIWHAYFGWMFSDEITNYVVYARDILSDRTLVRINTLYPLWVALGLAVPAAIVGAATGSSWGALHGFLWGGVIRMFVVNHANWCVGTFCHVFGSQPFATGDASRNSFWIALVSFGEGYHNNHHAFPSSASHGLEWWQPDLSAGAIKLLAATGLIWDVNLPSIAARRAKARSVVGQG